MSVNVADYPDLLLTDVNSLPTDYMYAWFSCSIVAHVNCSTRCIPAVLRQAVYLLPDQICLFDSTLYLRNRLGRMWSGSHIHCPHRWSCCRRCRGSRCFLWRPGHCGVHRASGQTSNLHGNYWCHVRARLRCWPFDGWSLYGSRVVAMVLLHQLALGCGDHPRDCTAV